MTHSIVLRELAMGLFDLLYCLFCGGYSVGIPKSCFQELYKGWWVFQSYTSVLPDMWQALAQGCSRLAFESVEHLRLFVRKAGGLVSYDHQVLSNPTTQVSSIGL